MSDFIVEVSGKTSKEPSGGPAALSVGGPITRAAGRSKRASGLALKERRAAFSGRLDLGEKGVRKALGLLGELIAQCHPPPTPALKRLASRLAP
jgi:hypothetical protein